MSLWLIILLDIAIFWFFFGNQVMDWIRFGSWKKRHALKLCRKGYHSLWLRDKDILTAEQNDHLLKLIEGIDHALHTGGDAVSACLAEQETKAVTSKLPAEKKYAKLRNFLEVAVVSLGVAFGIRALFLQPFKIPTGSMQVTLFGIHFEPETGKFPQGKIANFFSYLNYSHLSMDLTVQENGYFDVNSLKAASSIPFFPKTAFRIGERDYVLPGDPERVLRTLMEESSSQEHAQFFHGVRLAKIYGYIGNIPEQLQRGRYFRKGEQLVRGYLTEGDHLFVNRISLCFREPRRGDIMVFITDGLQMADGQPFGGRYYIKRLVGMPGDELMIKDRHLYVKESGKTEFRMLDGKDHPGFDKVHSQMNGYRGYANMTGAKYLTTPEDTFKVPEGHYFMLGDNSENSLDSRYWGVVPRRNLVGRPGFVWWPFSNRWGTL